MACVNNGKLRGQAAAEKDAVAYIDCVFHRRYAEHLPLATLLCDMRTLKNRAVLSYVGAMPFCQRAFLQTRTHLYRVYGDEIYILPKDYRDSVMNLLDYVTARTCTTLTDLHSFCSASHPCLVEGGLAGLRRLVDQHPALFELVEPAPSELGRQEVRSRAVVVASVLLFPYVKIAVGRVVNINGNMAYLECQGEFVTFHASNAGLPPADQLKTYLTKGDLVPFEARYRHDEGNGLGGPVVLAAAGVSSAKLRNLWKALAVELPRNPASECPRGGNQFLSPRGWDKAHGDDPSEWCARRDSTLAVQKRDSSTCSLAAASGPPGAARMGGGMGGLLTPPFSTVFSKQFNPFQTDVETQAGSGRPYVDKAVQTEVTDEELVLRLIRKYPNLLDNLK